MKLHHRLLSVGTLLIALSPLNAQSAERESTRATAGELGAAGAFSGFPGPADNFGRRTDADGDLIIVADELTASVVSISNVAFEQTNLLALTSVTNITGVIDVAIEGNRALVFVERSNGVERSLLLGFRRLTFGSPGWVAAGQADPLMDAGFGAAVGGRGQVELREGSAVIAFDFVLDGTVTSFLSLYAQSPSALSVVTSHQIIEGAIIALAVGASGGLIGAADEMAIGVGVEGVTVGNLALQYAASESASRFLEFPGLLGGQSSADGFGSAIAVHGSLMVVGEPGADVDGLNTGRVIVYNFPPNFEPIATLTSPTPTDGDRFGHALALNEAGTRLAIGELHSDAIPGGLNAGYVRLATPNSDEGGAAQWVLTQDTLGRGATVGGPGEHLGADMSWGADDLLSIGAPGTAELDGFVSWFPLPTSPWVEVHQSAPLAGTDGEFPELLLEGAAIVDGPIVVGVRNAAPSSTTFVILGFSPLFAPAKGGVIYPSIDFLKAFPTSPAGEFVMPTTWTSDSVALGPHDLLVQFWTIDAGGVSGFSATGGGVIHQY